VRVPVPVPVPPEPAPAPALPDALPAPDDVPPELVELDPAAPEPAAPVAPVVPLADELDGVWAAEALPGAVTSGIVRGTLSLALDPPPQPPAPTPRASTARAAAARRRG